MPKAKYDSLVIGTVVRVNPGEKHQWARTMKDHKVCWRQYAEGENITLEDGSKGAFIKIDDCQGFTLKEVSVEQGKPFSSY